MDSALLQFRRDPRLADNAALRHALGSARQVHYVFAGAADIRDSRPQPCDRRVEFIRRSIVELHAGLESHSGRLEVLRCSAPG
jgi:deoxyribodipyrimidine photo-lyase